MLPSDMLVIHRFPLVATRLFDVSDVSCVGGTQQLSSFRMKI